MPLDLDAVNEWMETENIGLIAPYASDTAEVTVDGESDSAVVCGVTSAFYEVQGLQLLMGR